MNKAFISIVLLLPILVACVTEWVQIKNVTAFVHVMDNTEYDKRYGVRSLGNTQCGESLLAKQCIITLRPLRGPNDPSTACVLDHEFRYHVAPFMEGKEWRGHPSEASKYCKGR